MVATVEDYFKLRRRKLTEGTSSIVIYTHPDCQGCDMVLDDLDAKGTTYQQIDVTEHPEAIPELLRLTGGERVTPVVVDGDTVSIGYRGIGCTF